MTRMGICSRCAEKKPPHVPHERRRVGRGPNGELLCARHRREAWEEYENTPSNGGHEWHSSVTTNKSKNWHENHRQMLNYPIQPGNSF